MKKENFLHTHKAPQQQGLDELQNLRGEHSNKCVEDQAERIYYCCISQSISCLCAYCGKGVWVLRLRLWE